MAQLKALVIGLNASNIAHKATETTMPDLEDNSVEITHKAKDGRKINIQVAHDLSPRGQADYSISLFDGKVMQDDVSTHNPHVVVQRVKELL